MGGGVGCVGGGGGGDRTLGLFVKSFLPALREKTTQEHLFHITQVSLRSLGGF